MKTPTLLQYLHATVAHLERGRFLNNKLPRELVVARALEVFAEAAKGPQGAAADLGELPKALQLLDAEAVRVFGAATTQTRAQIVKRELERACKQITIDVARRTRP